MVLHAEWTASSSLSHGLPGPHRPRIAARTLGTIVLIDHGPGVLVASQQPGPQRFVRPCRSTSSAP